MPDHDQTLVPAGEIVDVDAMPPRQTLELMAGAKDGSAAIGWAVERAAVLKPLVDAKQWSVRLGQSVHLKVEAWETMAFLCGVSASVTRVEHVRYGDDHGFSALAQATHIASGRVLSSGEGLCMTDEPRWRERTKYEWKNGRKTPAGTEPVSHNERKAMAQTRAVSRALRHCLAWITVLAGYDPTPAEEINPNAPPIDEEPAPPRKRPQPRQPAADGKQQAKTIGRDQQQEFWKRARGLGLKDEAVRQVLADGGYKSTAEIPAAKYRDAVKALEDFAKPPHREAI